MILSKTRRPKLMLTMAFVVAPVVILAACGGSSNAATTPTPASSPAAAAASVGTQAKGSPVAAATKSAANGFQDPCSLLTQSEVDTSVGQPLGAGKQVATLDDCQWTTTDYTADVDVTVGDWTGVKAAATSGSHAPVSIAGVGDEALNLNGSNGSNLYVRKGDQGFLIVINGPHIDGLPDHGLAQEKVLAKAVIGRLR